MKTKLLLIICFCFLSVFTFQSCEDDVVTEPEVGVSIGTQTNNVWNKALQFFAIKRLNELGLTYSIASPTASVTQAQQVRAMVDKGSKVIIVSPEEKIEEAVSYAIEKGVPVILLNNRIVQGYTSFVHNDNTKAGENTGNYMKSNQTVKRIIAFKIEDQPEVSEARLVPFQTAIGTAIPVEVKEISSFSKQKAKDLTKEILENNDLNDVNAIYALDDELALGVLEAIAEKKATQIQVVVGCGGSQTFLNEINTNQNQQLQLATTLFSPSIMTWSVDIAFEILNGATPEKENVQEPVIIDASNVAEYLVPNSPY